MSATVNIPSRVGIAVNVQPCRFDWTVIGLACVCVIPSMTTIDFAMPLVGAQYLAGSLFVLLGYQVLKRNPYRFMSLLIGCAPALTLMRTLFFYNSILVYLGVGVLLWAFVYWDEVQFLWRDPIWKWLAILGVVYWFLSFMITASWINNIRVIEFVLAVGATCLLSKHRGYLATAFVAMAISVSAYAIAMMPYGIRLGEGDLDNGQSIGNPILVGMPSALVVILAVSDRGRYLMMESNLFGRLVLCLTAAQWLIFSGSRGSWLVTISALLLIFSFNKESRKPLLIALILLSLLVIVVLQVTDRGAQTASTFDRTVDSNRSLASRTSGRSVMWSVLPAIFSKSPIWGWGPGLGAQVNKLYIGRTLLFHSLYLQVLVETGLLGAIPLAILIGCAVHRSIVHLRRFGEVTPLLGIVGFIMVGVSVTAFDIISGILFGLALMPREMGPRFAGRQLWAASVQE